MLASVTDRASAGAVVVTHDRADPLGVARPAPETDVAKLEGAARAGDVVAPMVPKVVDGPLALGTGLADAVHIGRSARVLDRLGRHEVRGRLLAGLGLVRGFAAPRADDCCAEDVGAADLLALCGNGHHDKSPALAAADLGLCWRVLDESRDLPAVAEPGEYRRVRSRDDTSLGGHVVYLEGVHRALARGRGSDQGTARAGDWSGAGLEPVVNVGKEAVAAIEVVAVHGGTKELGLWLGERVPADQAGLGLFGGLGCLGDGQRPPLLERIEALGEHLSGCQCLAAGN